jgi:hypothetical protein
MVLAKSVECMNVLELLLPDTEHSRLKVFDLIIYIYLSPPLIFPTTSTELGQKTARCESLRALLHYIEWDRIVTLTGAQAD